MQTSVVWELQLAAKQALVRVSVVSWATQRSKPRRTKTISRGRLVAGRVRLYSSADVLFATALRLRQCDGAAWPTGAALAPSKCVCGQAGNAGAPREAHVLAVLRQGLNRVALPLRFGPSGELEPAYFTQERGGGPD